MLGWGGYWGWDPVENAGLLPWFTATAFLHSVMVQERRSMLRVWNVTLVIVTFFLTIFGTFIYMLYASDWKVAVDVLPVLTVAVIYISSPWISQHLDRG